MRLIYNLPEHSEELLSALRELANQGPVPAVGHGDTAVGKTLLAHLGIPMTSSKKAQFKGIALTARRGSKAKDINRVNLFAKVPDWNVSIVKSSKELLDAYGYGSGDERRLNCTVSAKQPNGQGLFLAVDWERGHLVERHRSGEGAAKDVVAWQLAELEARLVKSQPASAWIVAVPSLRNGEEFFHFRYVTFAGRPRARELPRLLEMGTVTVDHLISAAGGRTVEKGPLFKIQPRNVNTVFPTIPRLDLLRM
ncbi:MAG: MvaI/BcnI family restriction endonuclease [Albidovulum sp.]|nr:MvaI/BcnI family restriction endonuclease [Albidovulum sp.]